ncbi:MAG: sigma 54-interacting transcriptional regulator [Polyangiaceae bacterium]|nr:sigma 54-interacting transcriptional regulator [Polyangiaceae bacterium]
MRPDEAPAFTLTDGEDSAVLLPSVRVRVTPPQGAPVEAALGISPLVVGTSPDCDLVIADARVSRRHCELRLTERGVLLRDLRSKNGTTIGQVHVHEAFLPRDMIATIGGSRLSVRVEGSPSILRLSASDRFGEVIGQSIAMRAVFARLERVAATAETVLLLGESGTGKEVVARAIHAASPRRGGPFVVFDCSAVAPSLVESELFGHVRGAFTGAVAAHAGVFEQAEGGTLFIDEVGELPLDLQPKLLRALEARQVRRVGSADWRAVDVRVVAATHRNLRARAAEGQFREDLHYRLAVVEVHLPALRERKEDIPALVERFLSAHTPPRAAADLPPHAMDLLTAHDWPGNVRELRNVVTRLLLFPELGLEALGERPPPPRAAGAPPAPAGGAPGAPRPRADREVEPLLELPLREAKEMLLEHFERRYLATKLRDHGGNVSRTADAIGLSRQQLHRLIERYALRRGEGR